MNKKFDYPKELKREGALSVSSEEKREVELSFSSEEPYLRFFGYEVLSHEDGAVDLTRLNSIGCLLFNHERGEVIGRIEKAWLEDKRGKALVCFDGDEKSLRIWEKVKSGTLKGVSVGYSVDEWEEHEAPEGEEPTYIAKKWTPFEVSIVSVPADPTVGVGRSMEEPEAPAPQIEPKSHKKEERAEKSAVSSDTIEKNSTNEKEISQMPVENKTDVPQIDERSIIENERARISEITAMCRDFNIDAESFIKEGKSVDEARAAILEGLRAKKAPAAAPHVESVSDGRDNFRDAAIDALRMKSGFKVEKASRDAQEMKTMSLRDLAIESIAIDTCKSRSELARMNSSQLYDELQRGYFNPTALFPAILDAAIKKNIVDLYNKVPTTFDLWTSKGSVSDFKATPEHNYIIGGGAFQKVGENGELPQSRPNTELLPTRKIDTYGAQFSMSRQAFINDDIGFLSRVPGVYAAAAKRKINSQVYEMLFNNDKIYDGKALFDASHGNVVTTGTAPSLASINALMLKLKAQKDPFGDALNITPSMLILPIGYGLEVDTILHSASITTEGSQNTGYNPLANKGLTYVEDATLNTLAGANAAPWFLVADAMSAKSIQVDYLNGVEAPTIRRSEKAGQLGFCWDIFLDWGITAVDFRGIAKNAGAKITL